MKRGLTDHGSSTSTETSKKLKIKIEKTLQDETRIQGELYICSKCHEVIGCEEDLLTILDGREGPTAVFQIAYNLTIDYEKAPETAFGFTGPVLCTGCSLHLGRLIFRVDQPKNVFMVPGNYLLKMDQLLVRKGELLLDANTRIHIVEQSWKAVSTLGE